MTAPSNSYGEIVKSSSIMGGVAAVALVLTLVRAKFAAVLVGTTGAGLLASFVAAQLLFATASGLGIQFSAVRDVAGAYARGDARQIGRIVLTLRRSCWITGLLGAVSLPLLSPWISELSFGSRKYEWQIAALGLAILLGNVQGGHMAVLQGTRRIKQLAQVQVLGAAGGTAASVGCYFWLGLEGLVPAILVSSLIQFLVTLRATRQVPVTVVAMSYKETFTCARGMVGLGIAMMWTALSASAVAYGINVVISHTLDLRALGMYSAAYGISAVFADVVLGAMGSDYYPRLAGVSDDHRTANRLVNEQVEIGLLLAVPGLVATMTLAPWIIPIFYSREFLPAATLLQWLALGCLGRVFSWPLGYLLIAKARRGWLIGTETSVNALHLVLVYAGTLFIGLTGAALAFFALYVVYGTLVFFIARRLTGFSWSRACMLQIAWASGFMLAGWLVAQIDSRMTAAAVAFPLILAAGVHTLGGLTTRLGIDHGLSRALARYPLLARLGPRGTAHK